MEKPLPDPVPSAASEEVAEQFRSFVDPDDVASIKQMEHLMFTATDKIWWQGLSRILEGLRYVQEASETVSAFQRCRMGGDCLNAGAVPAAGRALELITEVKMPYPMMKGQLTFHVTNTLATVQYI